jgi:glycerol-3-phosphate acyltransferase PlsY
MIFFVVAAMAYLLGSVNFSIVFFRITGRGDPRTQYSGNPGATNVYRQAGAAAAALVLALDMARAAAVAALALYLLDPAGVAWTGLALVAGNRYPCFHEFRGGKGVANYLGFSAMIVPWGALASALAWAAGYFAFRVPFIASFCMVAVLGGATLYKWMNTAPAVLGVLATIAFIVFNHRSNLADLAGRDR